MGPPETDSSPACLPAALKEQRDPGGVTYWNIEHMEGADRYTPTGSTARVGGGHPTQASHHPSVPGVTPSVPGIDPTVPGVTPTVPVDTVVDQIMYQAG
ncbi:hypothetical protein NDU88_006632 [Pleurodeles waltl]|uniref:Uncharacterized protein n=1 Tax=Pleurodeles waltl TaxID=8319 RepID=A0AAV7LR14_PLEWA|nr:hypothetical protein NDU88_006632 [Pleurodeles waltl]